MSIFEVPTVKAHPLPIVESCETCRFWKTEVSIASIIGDERAINALRKAFGLTANTPIVATDGRSIFDDGDDFEATATLDGGVFDGDATGDAANLVEEKDDEEYIGVGPGDDLMAILTNKDALRTKLADVKASLSALQTESTRLHNVANSARLEEESARRWTDEQRAARGVTLKVVEREIKHHDGTVEVVEVATVTWPDADIARFNAARHASDVASMAMWEACGLVDILDRFLNPIAGDCRRHAPSASAVEFDTEDEGIFGSRMVKVNGPPDARWASTAGTDWCGDYEAKP